VSLLDTLIWGRELEKAPPRLSPSSPSSPEMVPTELQPRPSLGSRNNLRDGYDCRANAALKAIRELAAPEGLIVWLGEHSPSLYQKLIRDLPNKISRAWNARAPYADFDALCFELVDTYARATERYRVAGKK
jgi:hypothetical protein